MSVLPRSTFLRNPFLGIRVFGVHSSESIFSESIFSESIFRIPFFWNPCFRNPFFLESIFFGIHVFRNPCFRNPFPRNSFFRNPCLSEFIFCTRAKMRKMREKKRISENGCVSLLGGNGEDFGIQIFGATHFGVSDFLGLWAGSRLHPSLGGWFVWGGVGS